MKQYIFDLIKNQNGLTEKEIVLNIVFSVIVGVVIFISYYLSHKGTIYSKKFNVSLVCLTILTATVMTVIGNNIALSLGMVGALSIIRFRTAIKDSRDAVYIFWTIIAGICCGVGDYFVVAVGSSAVFIVLLIFGCIRSDNRMLIIVRGSRNNENKIQSVIFTYFKHKAVLRVKNSTEESIEYIYEVTDKLLRKCEQEKEASITEMLYSIGNIDYVNIVMQNDSVAN